MSYLNRAPKNVFRFALIIFLFLHIGLILELVLIGHYESFWQFFPIISLGLGLVSVAANSTSLLLVKSIYLLSIVSGVLGVILHLKNNMEFELEMYPGLETTELLVKSFTGALPALAPGTLIPMGLLGFLLLQLKSKNESI